MASRFDGKTAVIIGAGGGIGRATARLLDQQGLHLVLADLNRDLLDETAARLGSPHKSIVCDITDKQAVRELMQQAAARTGHIDYLINAAGIIRPAWFHESALEGIEAQIAINLLGPLYCTRAALDYLPRGGAIVTISSLAGAAPETKSAVYTASKYGLRGLGLTLGVELRKRGIRVSTIFPDGVRTPMLEYEARNGGSPLTFLSDPVEPGTVAEAVLLGLRTGRSEIFVPRSGTLTARLIGLLTEIVPALWPLLERLGEIHRQKISF